MTEQRALTLVQSDGMGDWYCVEWAEHDGRRWIEPRSYGGAFMYSGRVGDADVEGTAAEMLELAEAIEAGRSCSSARRCAAEKISEGAWNLNSPRNSERGQVVTDEQAQHLAQEIRRVVRKD